MNNPAPVFGFRLHNRRASPATGFLIYCRPSSRSRSSYAAMSLGSAIPRGLLIFAVVSVSCLLLYGAADSLRFLSSPATVSFPHIIPSLLGNDDSSPPPAPPIPLVGDDVLPPPPPKLEKVLEDAAMEDRTVILTTLNEAWAASNSIIDLFLESFRIGHHTRRLLSHLVIVALDHKAYARCIQLHAHCFALVTQAQGDPDFHKEAYFMTPAYLKMMWRRIDFLRSVLEMGYNFVFTDADIMWFRDPFPRFYFDADFQIACDNFLGNPVDMQNRPNGGFSYVKSNNRTIEFYKFWFSSQENYPGYHDQDVLNFIKFDAFVENIGLKIRFLDTAYFGGLCEPSRDLNLVCTMHANCCYGLDSKLHDLKIMLQDWKTFLALPPNLKRSSFVSWRVPQNCSLASLHHYGSPKEYVQQALQ